jgi:two-component system NtrC family sensor kinase
LKVANLTDSRILIVDDQTANLRVLAAVLEFAGYNNVNCLSDSRNILPIFQEFQPDLILLDLHMPHVDGLAANGAELPPDVYAKVSKMHARIDNAHAGAVRVKDLVSKLRTFSRLDEGTVKTINIHESIESVLLFLRHKMEGRIEVERNYGDVEMLTCLAGELNQVLMNIIANAIDAIDANQENAGPGRITIATGQQNGHFVIRVRDTGKGIPEGIRNRIFEPFFTTKPIGQGTGLGLAISYGIVQAHQGSMEFSSTAGEGTEFVLKIPTSMRVPA